MNVFLFILFAVICCVVGVFGFCQIIGVIKYNYMFSGKNIAATVIIWLIILSVVAGILIAIVPKLWAAVCVGYVISFLLSLNVSPD